MGTLRLLLALAVAIGHGGGLFGYRSVNGLVAVESFFVISGFYMSMVIAERYSSHERWFRLFWTSRYLRLAPLYILISVVTVVVSALAAGKWLTLLREGDPLTLGLAALSALSLIGQDVFMFLGYDLAGHKLYFLHDGLTGGLATIGTWPTPGYSFLPIEPGWSIGIEIWFYLLAPFILPLRFRWTLLVFGVSLAVRAILTWGMGWSYDPWTYRFFPSELAFFMAGHFGYRVYANPQCGAALRRFAWFPWICVIVFGLSYAFVPLPHFVKANLFVLAVALSVPAIFALTNRWTTDRWLGELSYPIYLIHMPVLGACAALGEWKAPVGLALTVALSVAGYVAIERPIDAWRSRLARAWPRLNPRIAASRCDDAQ
jgi:peptidoglycan/LPS O-acetylase OafA/YrhL